MDANQIQNNIRHSRQLRQAANTYNVFAGITALLAIASYVGAASALKDKEHVSFAALLAIGIWNNLITTYSLAQSYKTSKKALEILKHNTKEK